jgi:hypothetical protein
VLEELAIGAVTLVLGALLGAVLQRYVSDSIDRRRERRRVRAVSRRRELIADNATTSDWLIAYYEQRGAAAQLFRCRIGDYEAPIPFLVRPEWIRHAKIVPGGVRVLEYARTRTRKFEVDKQAIARRTELGQRLFDDDSCYLDHIEERDGRPVLHLKPCRYFEGVTTLIRLEDETYACCGAPPTATPRRDALLPGLDDLPSLLRVPRPVGGAVVLAVRGESGYEVLLHTRAHSTVTVGGLTAVMPNFTVSPPPSVPDASSQRAVYADVLIYNALREYLEELFDYEALISAADDSRLDPLWFAELPEARRLIDLAHAGSLSLDFLGFGFDALTGGTVVALLLVVDDLEFSAELRRTAKTNWEVGRGAGGRVDASFVHVGDASLGQRLERHEYHSGAAFALALALRRLGDPA